MAGGMLVASYIGICLFSFIILIYDWLCTVVVVDALKNWSIVRVYSGLNMNIQGHIAKFKNKRVRIPH